MAVRFPLDDQHILEEDYDENYEPTDEGKLGRINSVLTIIVTMDTCRRYIRIRSPVV